MAKMGRPTLRSDQRIELFLEALRGSATKNAAAAAAGVSWGTIRDWIADDEDLQQQVKLAENEAQLALIKVVHDAATGVGGVKDYRAALELLKRRFRHDGWSDGFDVRKLDDETILGLLKAHQEAQDSPEDKLQQMIDSGYISGYDAI